MRSCLFEQYSSTSEVPVFVFDIIFLVIQGGQSVEYDDVEGERDGDGGEELVH